MFKVAWDPIYVHPVPKGHRFPMEKYELLPLQLIHEGIINENQIFSPSFGEVYDYSIHCPKYLERLRTITLSKKEERASGFKQSKTLIEREFCITNGTIEIALSALNDGIGFNIAGGTHHAFSNRPEGFCLLNDQAVASMHLIKHKLAKKILIIDLDVHQGNGTAEILNNIPDVFTFSMHGKKNYPLEKPKSNFDIALEDGTEDDEYLKQLNNALDQIFSQFAPDFMFYQSGVDVLNSDKLGRLSLSLEGCKKRDEIVFERAKKENLPIAVTMGGGYSLKISDILNAHRNTFQSAIDIIL